MTPYEQIQKNIDAFYAAIEPIKDAFGGDSFAYVAVRSGDGWVIIQARLLLNVQATGRLPTHLQTKSLRAGHFLLSDLKTTREQVIASLLTGKLETPDGVLLFPPNTGGQYGTVFQPFHDDGLKTASRLAHLTIFGGQARDYINQPELDWELRAAATPFDGLQDVLSEYRPGVPTDGIRVEVAAFGAATIDYGSHVEGAVAKLSIRTSLTIQTAKIAVSYRVLEKGAVVLRSQIPGSKFNWSDQDTFKLGTTEIAVPRGAVVHAIASYNGAAQHHYFFSDPSSFQNSRRAAYEASDPKFVTIDDILAKSAGSKPPSRDFEVAIPWLFWMLGYSPASLVGQSRLSEAPDSLLATPHGHLAVVECTVGLLKEDHKLPKLHDRVLAVRRNLERSNLAHIRVLPVIVTAKTLEEVRPDIEAAEKLGIYVITREEIERLKLQTLLPPSADLLYEQAERAVSDALARHANSQIPDLFEN